MHMHIHTCHTHKMYSKFYLFTQVQYFPTIKWLAIILHLKTKKNVIQQLWEKPISGCWYLYQTSCIQRVLFQYESMPEVQSVMYFFSVASILSNGLSISILSTVGWCITETTFTVFSMVLWLVKGTFYSGLIYLLLLQTEPTC